MPKLIVLMLLILCTPSYALTIPERITRLEASFESHVKADEQALLLATSEIHRRLNDLNGEAGRLKEMQIAYIPRGEYVIEHKILEGQVAELEKYNTNQIGQISIIAGIVTVLVNLGMWFVFKWINKDMNCESRKRKRT